VRPQDVVQRAVDRTEERAAIAPALGVGQARGRTVEVLVLPAVIGRHRHHVARPDHARSLAAVSSDDLMKRIGTAIVILALTAGCGSSQPRAGAPAASAPPETPSRVEIVRAMGSVSEA